PGATSAHGPGARVRYGCWLPRAAVAVKCGRESALCADYKVQSCRLTRDRPFDEITTVLTEADNNESCARLESQWQLHQRAVMRSTRTASCTTLRPEKPASTRMRLLGAVTIPSLQASLAGEACGGPSILRQRTLDIREPVFAQDLQC